nr:protein eyes shut-like isoform X1 [Ciona intestinalis]|eukprot:XP_002124975.3 protein eyes shut-like isoform X1 [Ciona intestinalis]
MYFKLVLFGIAMFGAVQINANAINATTPDPCSLFNPCLHNGRCYSPSPDIRACDCNVGYYGSVCQFVDHCASNPCANNGTCIRLDNGYNCTCNEGYLGRTCEVLDACIKGPCSNGGICTTNMTTGSPMCDCVGLYTGKSCEIHCYTPQDCGEQSIHCVFRSGLVVCRCVTPVGKKSAKCILPEDRVDECQSNPCQGRGRCRDMDIGYQCRCYIGFVGKNCEMRAYCSYENPCQNRGTCQQLKHGRNYRCNCPPNFAGRNCEIYIAPVCSVTCTSSAIQVSCDHSRLPKEIRSQTLETISPLPSQQCTCRFPVVPGQPVRQHRYRYTGYSSRTTPATPTPCTIPFDSCGTQLKIVNNTIYYLNHLRYGSLQSHDQTTDSLVTREYGQFELKLECSSPLLVKSNGGVLTSNIMDIEESLELKSKSNIPIQISVSYWGVQPNTFLTHGTTLAPITEFKLDTRIYVLLSGDPSYSTTAILTMQIYPVTCYLLTNTTTYNNKYYLFEDGCKRDETVRMELLLMNQQQGTLFQRNVPKTLFSFEAATFKRENDVQVVCSALICNSPECEVPCAGMNE